MSNASSNYTSNASSNYTGVVTAAEESSKAFDYIQADEFLWLRVGEVLLLCLAVVACGLWHQVSGGSMLQIRARHVCGHTPRRSPRHTRILSQPLNAAMHAPYCRWGCRYCEVDGRPSSRRGPSRPKQFLFLRLSLCGAHS